jgi:riboflavin-specific deaminase-like protein
VARPYVTVHFAQSLDGHIDRPAAERNLTISNEAGFAAAHQARAEHDAVLVGIQTVLRDDPRLLVSRSPGKHPDRVVLDSSLRLPLTARLLDPTPGVRVIVLGCRGHASPEAAAQLEQRGASVHLLEASDPSAFVPLVRALHILSELGVKRLLVEGGSKVIQGFLRARVVDALHVEIAPRVIGADGLSGLSGFPGGFELENVELLPLGSHILMSGKPIYS